MGKSCKTTLVGVIGDMNDPLYVAETDELGNVVFVWFSDDMRPRARPLRDPGKHLPKLNGARFSGSSPEAIRVWMQKQETAQQRH